MEAAVGDKVGHTVNFFIQPFFFSSDLFIQYCHSGEKCNTLAVSTFNKLVSQP